MKTKLCLKVILINLIINFFIFSIIYGFNTFNAKEVRVGKVIDKGIYDLDISWDRMQFIYSEEESLVFDSKTNTYKIVNNKNWTSLGNEIVIKNMSDRNINVVLNYIKNSEFLNINGVFSKNNLEIKNGKSEIVALNLDGKIPKDVTEYKKIGEIKINIE